MTTKNLFLIGAMLALFAACSGDYDNGSAVGAPTTSQADDPANDTSGFIDRAGRPGVATALIGTFNPNADEKGALRDRYNDASPSTSAGFVTNIASSLAIYDALAGTCGDNPLTASGTGPTTYNAFATVLANDQLLVNGDVGSCDQYLAVELGEEDECGGRRPNFDVIDVTFSAVAAGETSGVSDGVNSDDQTPSNSFPFLAAPRQ